MDSVILVDDSYIAKLQQFVEKYENNNDEKNKGEDYEIRKICKRTSKKMSLKEKVAQLSQTVAGYRCYNREGEEFYFTDDFKAFIKEYGAMGAISNILRACSWTQKDWGVGIEPKHRIKVANQLQKYAIENSRLGIPVLIEVEANHGLQALGSELFPTNIGMGCTFNPELYREVMKSVGTEVKLSANHMSFVTMFDMARDPRWGRCEEFFSEDPYLASMYAQNGVEGVKEGGALVCCKHYCATGDCFGGINVAEVNVGKRELYDIHLPAVRSAVKSGADVIMAAYNAVDGIPCHANSYLLREVLRDELGFKGIILSDGWGVERMILEMGYDKLNGCALALKSGVDLSLADNGAYLYLIEACEKGIVSEELIDESVLRILTKKFELGLFDNPYAKEDNSLVAYLDSGIQKELSYKAAAESAVLLKNNGILPLDKGLKVALIGAHADNIYYQLGDYTSLRKKGEGKTIREAFEDTFNSVEYTPGWDFGGSYADFENAQRIAENSDVIVMTLGGSTARTLVETEFDANTGAVIDNDGFMDCGEGRDVSSIALPVNQVELFAKLKQLGKPIIALLIQGRPYEITSVDEIADAVITAWYPGQQGATAIADIFTGKVNPSGKLSVSIPYKASCLPAYYNCLNNNEAAYVDTKRRVLYPFGYGLSYSEFEYDNLQIKKIGRNEFEVSCTVENKSHIAGKEVVQLYIHGRGNTVKRRKLELKGFEKIKLDAHESKKVTFKLGYDELKVYSARGKFEVENGCVKIFVGSPSGFALETEIETEAQYK